MRHLPQGWKLETIGQVCSKASSNISQNQLKEDEGDYPIYGASGFIKNVSFYHRDKDYIAIVKDGAGIGRTTRLKAHSSVIGTLQYIIPNQEIDVNFLYYFLNSVDLTKYQSGATIPHIYFKDYSKEPLPLPPIPQQEKIVSVLDTASALVEKQKALLKKYDLFLKSKFIEMFGDPVKNPMGWEVKGFLDILNLTTGKLDSNASEEDGIYPFFTCAQETFAINTYAFDCEALLLAGNNAAGVYSIKHYNGKFNAYQRTYVLTLKDTKSQYEFFKMLLETKLLELQNVSIGTNTKYLTLGILKNINMYIPEQKLQVEFSKIVKQTETLKQKEQQKLEKLQTLYDALMSKAFKGEIK